MTDLAGTQISNLLEALPGIAKVLRSPVADAFVGLIQAASGEGDFDPADADEIMQYAVRRNLIASEEAERVMEEARASSSAKRKAPKAGEKSAGKPKTAPAKSPKPVVASPPKKVAKKTVGKSVKASRKRTAKKAVRKAVRKPPKKVAKRPASKRTKAVKPSARRPHKKK
jgi:hypothetical protein